MKSVKGAFLEAFTGGWLESLPYVMAWLAEMMSAEAEPSGCFAAVATLVHDIFCAMLLTVSFASRFSDRKALAAQEGLMLFLWLLFFLFLINILLG